MNFPRFANHRGRFGSKIKVSYVDHLSKGGMNVMLDESFRKECEARRRDWRPEVSVMQCFERREER